MGIITSFTLRSLKRNSFRTVVSIIGIALACALLTAVCTSVVTFQTLLEQRTRADEGSWQVLVENVTPDQLQKLADSPRLDTAQTVTELGAVRLGDKNAKYYGDYLYLKTWPEELSHQSDQSSEQTSSALALPADEHRNPLTKLFCRAIWRMLNLPPVAFQPQGNSHLAVPLRSILVRVYHLIQLSQTTLQQQSFLHKAPGFVSPVTVSLIQSNSCQT